MTLLVYSIRPLLVRPQNRQESASSNAAVEAVAKANEVTIEGANIRLALALGSTVLMELLLPIVIPCALIRLVLGLLER